MKFKWKAQLKISDGNHRGKITRVGYRDEPYEYTDITIALSDQEGAEITYSCPSTLSPSSKLGTLLQAFGAKFELDKELDPAEILVGKECSFMTINKKSKKNPALEFAEIVAESVKPIK